MASLDLPDLIIYRTESNPPLVARLMNYLSSVSAVDEVGEGRYRANAYTKNLASDLAQAGISHW